MFFLEGFSKATYLFLVAYVSYSDCGAEAECVLSTELNRYEIGLVVMVVTGCLFELGEILARSGVKIHMSDVWNALDCVSNSLVLSWFICRMYPSQVTPLSLHPYIPLSKESLTQLVNPLTQHFKTLQLTHFCTRLYEHKLVQCIYEHHASSFFNPLTHFCTRLYEHHSLFFFLLHSTTSPEGSWRCPLYPCPLVCYGFYRRFNTSVSW